MKTMKLWPSAVIAIVLLAGCVEQPPPYVEPTTDAEAIQYWLDIAHAEGASKHQIEVLERALERGTVLRSDVNEMLPEYYDCMDATGLTYYVNEEEAVPGSGVSIPAASAVMPGSDEDEWERLGALMDSCGEVHEAWIATAYANQPTSLELEAKVWTGDAMRDCLTDRGLTVDKDATAAEIKALWDDDITEHIDDPDFHVC